MAALEAAVAIVYGKRSTVSLSVQQVIDCEGHGSCNGGWPQNTLEYSAKKFLTEEKNYPYVQIKRACKDSSVSQCCRSHFLLNEINHVKKINHMDGR